MNAVIETRGLTRRFRKTVAVNDLSLEVPSGSIFALLGPNGAGKTTLIKMVMNMVRPSGGKATIMGIDSLRLGPPQLERIGYVSENQELPEWMTVQELIDYCRPLYPTWGRRLVPPPDPAVQPPPGSETENLFPRDEGQGGVVVVPFLPPGVDDSGRTLHRAGRPGSG